MFLQRSNNSSKEEELSDIAAIRIDDFGRRFTLRF